MDIIRKLENMGCAVYTRPDIYDGKNTAISIIIDEREEYFKMINAITLTASSECIEEFLETMFENYSEGFITDIIKGINEYLYGHSRVAKERFSAKEWWGAVVPTIILAMEQYGINLEEIDSVEYSVAKKRLGGRRGIRTFVKKALENKPMSRCLTCEHCRLNSAGDYVCRCIIVETDHTNGSILAKLISGNKFASNRCSDIIEYGEECDRYSARYKKTFMNRIFRFIMS